MTKGGILSIRLRIISICFCLAACLLVSGAQAEKLPFMSQSKIRVVVSPGERAFGEITLDNPTDENKVMRLYLEDWYYLPGGSGAKEFLPAKSLPTSACSWITFSPAEVVIPAFGKQKINYSINVPADASGARFATLFFETLMSKGRISAADRSAGLDVHVRVATLFYVEVKGTVKRSAKINNLNIQPSKETKEALDFTLDFENTGNTDITTSGNFSLINNDGMVAARGALNNVYTFPGGKGSLLGTWKGNIPAGDYDLVVTVDLGKALADAGTGRGPVITKEASVAMGENNQVVQIGQLK
ncbi:MAG TPA: hypothetical protein PKI44_06585 [Candidatus Omnitrophota bacterium]|nr:hypothetical protein [Candidatus Omnitrophota bacterium]